MSDIVERLRERAVIARDEGNATATSDAYHFWEAAKEIDRLRAALLKITNSVHGSFDDAASMADIARAALEAKDD